MTDTHKVDPTNAGCCGTVTHSLGPKGLNWEGTPPIVNNPALCGTTGADAIVRQAIMVACMFWAAKGITDPAEIQVFMYDEGNGQTDAFAYLNYIIAVDRKYRDEHVAVAGSAKYDKASRRHALAQLGAVLIHERGHNLGQHHTSDPNSIMYGGTLQVIPAEAAKWAALWVP